MGGWGEGGGRVGGVSYGFFGIPYLASFGTIFWDFDKK